MSVNDGAGGFGMTHIYKAVLIAAILAAPAAIAMDGDPTYAQVVGNLTKASVPLRQLDGPGNVAVTLASGRVVALAFSEDGPDLLWSNPKLGDTDLVKTTPEKLVGGFGGDRLWFAPELDYYWDGKPDWKTFANNKA